MAETRTLEVLMQKTWGSSQAGERFLFDEDTAAVLVGHGMATWADPSKPPAGAEYAPKLKAVAVQGEPMLFYPDVAKEAAARKAKRESDAGG